MREEQLKFVGRKFRQIKNKGAAKMPSFRLDRTSEDVKRELTDIMRTLKDPRINGLLSILKVDLSKDLSLCRVYVLSLIHISEPTRPY